MTSRFGSQRKFGFNQNDVTPNFGFLLPWSGVTNLCKEGVTKNSPLRNSTSFFLRLGSIEYDVTLLLLLGVTCQHEVVTIIRLTSKKNFRDDLASESINPCDTQEDQFPVADVVIGAAIVPIS